jgi:hypothetical protein
MTMSSSSPFTASDPFVECFQVHREYVDRALALADRLQPTAPRDSADLRHGGASLHLSALQALSTSDEQATVRAWLECELGDQQIRRATYRALRHQAIGSEDYDRLFAAAVRAGSARSEQLLRLRQRLRLMAIV